ncbi:unnamed protein product [Leptidea sinapis]|uniref:PHR domain-containing protein n=1 Tax=Leptidea sinapis TaxID=189913 RepID=A0A5E4QX30_9NEOP|nr:unnamed protein product [Leptidea sinapis]
MDDSVFETRPHSSKQEKKQTTYRWRSCFASEDEYAQYLSDVITPGMTIALGDVGQVQKVERDIKQNVFLHVFARCTQRSCLVRRHLRAGIEYACVQPSRNLAISGGVSTTLAWGLFTHWIRVEIRCGVRIRRLGVGVSVTSGSYAACSVSVRGGASFEDAALAPLAAVPCATAAARDRPHAQLAQIQLLADCKQYYPCIEIGIKQNRNVNADCRVYGLYITGFRPNPLYTDVLSVYVWGLNDKDQLGGVKGSKVKVPVFSPALSALRPLHITGGSKTLFVVSHDGKVEALAAFRVVQVACGSRDAQTLALTACGKVFSWGDGDFGKLGNGTTSVNRRPGPVTTVEGVHRVAAGSSHSAAWALRPAGLATADVITPHVAPLPFPALKDPLGAHSLDLLKLAAAGRIPDASNAVKIITDVLMGLCMSKPSVADMVVEVCVCELEEAAAGSGRVAPQPVTVDSPHPYADDTFLTGVVKIPGASSLRVSFEPGCSTERRNDPLTILDASGRESGTDRWVLSRPSVELAWRLLDGPLLSAVSGDHQLAPRLAQALAVCAQMCALRKSSINGIVKEIKSIELELAWLACGLRTDARVCSGPDAAKWAWFKRYCLCMRTADALLRRTPLPAPFLADVRKRLADLGIYIPEESTTDTNAWEDNTILTRQHDEQLLHWVACNSGGKHCLALSSDGDVYSWGEGEDGKLGHGNRVSYDRPKLITALSGLMVVAIACGGAHSACLTARGRIYTWGKGRYGRLGHGDSEDQLVPKMGDYHRLGHGSYEHVRRPMRVTGMQGKTIVSIATGYVIIRFVYAGSLHCVACTDTGEVYTWGDNDEGQLGDGTTLAAQRPRLLVALQVCCSETQLGLSR